MLLVEGPGILFWSKGYVSYLIIWNMKSLLVNALCPYLFRGFSLLQIAFTRKKDFGKEQRELKWAHAQRTLHGLQVPDSKLFNETNNFSELNQLAEEAKRRAEIARYRCLAINIISA